MHKNHERETMFRTLQNLAMCAVFGLILTTTLVPNASSEEPTNTIAYTNRGDAHLSKGDLNKALADYNKAIELDPKFAKAYGGRGLAHEKKGSLDKAYADYTKAIDLDRKFAWAYANRGDIYRVKREFNKALADITEAIEIDPKLALAYYARGHFHVDKGDLNKALADYTKATELDPKDPWAFYGRGFVHQEKNKLYHAIADYTESLRLDPKNEYAAKSLSSAKEAVRKSYTSPKIRLLEMKLDEELKQVVLKKSPAIRLAAGTEKVIEDTVKVQHSVSTTDGWTSERELRGKVTAWFVEVSSSVRSGIEKKTTRTFGVETERKRSVTVKGDRTVPAVRVVWVEYHRTGTAELEVDGEKVTLPFSFREDFDLLTEEAIDPVIKK
jgi:tetratricopeptide (TPR) repeat protein